MLTPVKALVALLALLVLGVAAAGAQTTGQAPSTPVTDYAGYPGPQHGVPAGCTTGDMAGLSFQRARAGAATVTAAGLSQLGPILQGDTLTMTWAGVAPECVGGVTSLAVKRAQSASFNINDNQEFTSGVSVVLTGGPGQLVLTVFLPPDLVTQRCFVQIDAVFGQPLAIVGPLGSYYGSIRPGGGPNVLLSAYNGELLPCVPGTTTTLPGTTSTVPETTTTVPETTTSTVPGTTSTVPGTTSTVPGTSSTVPPTSSTAPSMTPTSTRLTATSSGVGGGDAQARGTIPATGPSWTGNLLLVVLLLGLLGGTALYAARVPRR